MSPEVLLSARDDADGHRLAGVVAFGLHDDAARDAARAEVFGDVAKRALVGNGQHDGEGPRPEVSGARLASRVKQVRGEDAQRKVTPNDGVVSEGRGGFFSRAPVRRLTA
jgi:predicted alpha/beta-hydrolase family hydrolase